VYTEWLVVTLSGQHATDSHKNPVRCSQSGAEALPWSGRRRAGLGRGKSQGLRGHARSSARGSGLEQLRT